MNMDSIEKAKCNCTDKTDKCLDCKYSYIDNLFYEIQCKKHNHLVINCNDFIKE